jgi:hypothetical protein
VSKRSNCGSGSIVGFELCRSPDLDTTKGWARGGGGGCGWAPVVPVWVGLEEDRLAIREDGVGLGGGLVVPFSGEWSHWVALLGGGASLLDGGPGSILCGGMSLEGGGFMLNLLSLPAF